MAPARAQSAVRSSGTGVGSNWWAALLDGPRSRSDRTSRLRSCTARAARLTSAAGKHRAARLLLDAALRARQAATSRGELLVVARALLRAVACARGDAPLQRSARERLALLLCQEGLASEAGLDALLARGGYSHRLASHCLRYEEEEAAPSAAGRAAAMAWHCLARPVPPPVPPPGGGARGGAFVACLEGALPRGMVGRLAAALGPSSPFWASHGYICDGVRLASPFFSYVHSLRGPPASGLDRAIRRLQRLAAAAMPEVAEAGHAEWWAHCRPHATGHQMHFDSADEGRGARGPRHPLVSCALFLTSSAGGPTLVTDQTPRCSSLASSGYAALPRANRLLLFGGSMLHGVVPGRGARGGAARVSLMVAFWPSLEAREAAEPSAARPFPYGGAPEWAPLFDWPEEEDGDGAAGGGGGESEGREGDSTRPAPLRLVSPIWQSVQGGGAPAAGLRRMPPYEACFQGF